MRPEGLPWEWHRARHGGNKDEEAVLDLMEFIIPWKKPSKKEWLQYNYDECY